jgi:hypothetical protein
MAKNEGLFKLRGLLDDTVFRITEDGNIASRKTGPSSEKVLTHENFDRTRRNAAEFKMAVQDGAELRYALGRALNGKVGSSLNGRMNGLMHLIAQQDPMNDFGNRRACYGDVSLLNGFDFNKQLPMAKAWKLRFTHSLDAVNGILKLELNPFVAHKKKKFPEEATHFRIISGGSAVDFLRSRYERDIQVSELLPLSKKTPGVICFAHQVKVKPGDVLVQVLGIEFYKLVRGNEVLVKGTVLQVVEALKKVQSHEFRVESQGIEAERQQGNERETGVESLESSVQSQVLEGIQIEDEVHESEELVVCKDTGDISCLYEPQPVGIQHDGMPVRGDTNRDGGLLDSSMVQPGVAVMHNPGDFSIFATLLLENESFMCPEGFRASDSDP